MLISCFRALVLLVLVGFSQAAQSGLLEKSYWRDATGRTAFEEAVAQPFSPFEGMLSQGYDSGAVYWLKFKIPASQSPHEWVLRFQPSWHDDIRLFDSFEPAGNERVSGDWYPSKNDEFWSLGPSFRLTSHTQARDVYVRIRSIHSYQVDVELQELSDAESSERLRLLGVAAYLSWMIFVLLLASLILLNSPVKTVVLFFATELCALFYTLHMFGVSRVLLDAFVPNFWLHHAHVLTMFLTAITITQFYAFLLSGRSQYRWVTVVLYVTTLLPILALVLYVFGESTRALQVNAFGTALFSVTAFLFAWFGLSATQSDDMPLPNWTLRLFFSFIVLVGFFNSVPLFGWVQASRFSMWLFLFHGPLLLTFMGLALVLRYRQIINTQESEFKLVQMKAEQERIARVEQSKLLAMINHEVKTPMAVLKLMLAGQPVQAKAEAQVDAVVTLIERSLMLDQMNDLKDQRALESFKPQTVVQQCIDKTGANSRFELVLATGESMMGDPVLYGVIVSNLLDNAIKYSPAYSVIRAELLDSQSSEKPCVSLTVCNEIGRAGQPDPARLYDKYYRADAARHVSGTGLGLYLVKSLTQWLGGEVSCETVQNQIRFKVCIPR
jgi:signal transduction histidine kinase